MDTTVHRALAYDLDSAPVPGAASHGVPPRLLDLYLPPEPRRPVPVVLVIHGGGWFSQNRTGGRERSIAVDLVKAGFAAASIDYTLVDLQAGGDTTAPRTTPSGGGIWPQMLTDCKRAVAYLRRNAATYRIDPRAVGAVGGSAGAHLAAMLGVTGPEDGFEPEVDGDSSVQAVVYLYGVCDITGWLTRADEPRLGMRAAELMVGGTPDAISDAYRAASPVHYLHRDVAPMLLIHGEQDEIIPISETERFHRRLHEVGAASRMIPVPSAGHSFDLHPPGMDLTSDVAAFLSHHLRSTT